MKIIKKTPRRRRRIALFSDKRRSDIYNQPRRHYFGRRLYWIIFI